MRHAEETADRPDEAGTAPGHAPPRKDCGLIEPPLLWAGHQDVRLKTRGVRPIGGIMIILGLILLVIGLIAGIGALWTIGIILVAIGAVLWVLGALGHAVGGRRHYW